MSYVITITIMLFFRASEMALTGHYFIVCMYTHDCVCPDDCLCETVAAIMQSVTEGFCSVNGLRLPCDLNL